MFYTGCCGLVFGVAPNSFYDVLPDILQVLFMTQKTRKKGLFAGEFWQNNWLVALVVLLAVLNLAILGIVVYQVRPINSPVPIRYTSFANFDQLGSWMSFYAMTATSWLVSLVNVYLAQLVYKRSRITSVVLVVATFVMTLLAFQATAYFIGVSYGPRQ